MIDVESLYELDKGTLSTDGLKALKREIKKAGARYIPYFERVGPGLANVATELKRELDKTVLPELAKALPKATDQRFKEVFCDVRIYPGSRELESFDKLKDWSGTTLTVLVSFVLSIPMDDSLDSMARLSLVSLFDEKQWDPAMQKLNVDIVSQLMGACGMDEFRPSEFNGLALEIIVDGCSATDFVVLQSKARGAAIPIGKFLKKDFTGVPTVITANNATVGVPLLIAAIAKVLGVKNLNPGQLQRSDNLYALMGFDDTLTRSLVLSIMGHFNVLGVIGGDRMVTVGNAIDFAIEYYESAALN